MTVPSADARYRTLFEEYYPLMRNYCLRRLSVDDTNDALAEIFLVVWRKIDAVPPGEEARLWLYSVARNVVANQRRSRVRRSRLQARMEEFIDRSPEPGVEAVVVRRSQDAELIAALERLKHDDQELLRLKIWDELSHTEIGAVFGISAHAVDMRVRRATKKLARLLHSINPRGNPRPIVKGGER